MARIETDPNYTTPTFSRATAGTDLFKKEDVQQLAAALSTHDHSTGKGLILPASAIPDGAITSAKIADGTIATADIGLNQVQNRVGNYLAVPTFSTTTVSTWVATPISATFNTTGRLIRVMGQTTLLHSLASGAGVLGIALDGVVQATVGLFNAPGSNYAVPISWAVYLQPGAGVHNVSVYVQSGAAGTLAISGSAQSELDIIEELR